VSAPQPGKPEGHPLAQIVSTGVKAGTAGSLISASLNFNDRDFTPSGATAPIRGGDELRIRQRGEHVYAEVVGHGKVVEARPSGRFKLADGKTLVIEKGRIVGGDPSDKAKFALFALLTDWPAERGT
jgi:hypothetical protein